LLKRVWLGELLGLFKAMIFWLRQFKFYRQMKKGTWVKVRTQLNMADYWCLLEEMPRCCGAHIVETEEYDA